MVCIGVVGYTSSLGTIVLLCELVDRFDRWIGLVYSWSSHGAGNFSVSEVRASIVQIEYGPLDVNHRMEARLLSENDVLACRAGQYTKEASTSTSLLAETNG